MIKENPSSYDTHKEELYKLSKNINEDKEFFGMLSKIDKDTARQVETIIRDQERARSNGLER